MRANPSGLTLVVLLAIVTLLTAGASVSSPGPPPAPPPPADNGLDPEPLGADPPPQRQEDLILAAGPLPPVSEADPQAVLERIGFLVSPIAGARMTMPASHLPGAPRAYRHGWHQGIDFYDGHVGVPVRYGDPVRAAGAGVVLRADHGYVEIGLSELERLLAEAAGVGETPAATLDRLHGQQVWLDHGGGVISRYSHLAGIVAGIVPGARVGSGQVLGYIGNSGTGSAARGTRAGPHLHFEIHLDGRPFWTGLAAADIRAVLRAALEED